jgi:hypothetical protein
LVVPSFSPNRYEVADGVHAYMSGYVIFRRTGFSARM